MTPILTILIVDQGPTSMINMINVITMPVRLVIQIPLRLQPSAPLIFQSVLRGQMGKGHGVVGKEKSG